MELKEIISELELTVLSHENLLEQEVEHAYMSDLLSDVIANAKEGDIWITLQIHPNIVAIASMRELGAVLIIGGRAPEEETVEKANEQDVVILSSPLPAFELCGRLYKLGITGE